MAETIPNKKFRFTIRIGIVLVFVSIFLVMSLLIMSLVAWRSYQNAVLLTNQVTSAISTSVMREVTSQLNPALTTSKLSSQLITSGTLDPKITEQMLNYTQRILAVLSSAKNSYWGDEQGNFIISRREDNGTLSSEVINRSAHPNYRYRIDRDLNGKTIKKTVIEKMDYDPRDRPWYAVAKHDKQSAWSAAYVFYSGRSGTLGITSATPVYQNQQLRGVYGIDMKLQSIAEFLAKVKISENGSAFIVNQAGNLIAYSGTNEPLAHVNDIKKPEVRSAYENYQIFSDPHFNYSVNGYRYHAAVLPVPGFEQYKWLLFIIVPDSDIIGPILRANYQTLVVCLFFMFIGILIISYLSNRISRPIRDLAHDLERVRLFDIRLNPKAVDTRVREIFLMSDAITRMKIGLLSFNKYVPRGLVQLLIEQGEAAKLGGKQREITLMFTDIRNFTALAERTSADEIMVHLCEYFDLLGAEIETNHGIVDKFIGDAVMAFWGAPEQDENQSYNACMAAIGIQEKIDQANTAWLARGMQALPTGIGIHRGDATVGNLGSHERLNYTAIGDTVNISSRLEMLNKVYGTRIIVSQDVYDKSSDYFIFRALDKVVLKGRNRFNYIYELLAVKTPEAEEKYNNFLERFSQALKAYQEKKFQVAEELFQSLLNDYPKDAPAKLYVERCQVFAKTGVPEGWDGAWVFTQKDTQR